jgi:hypothetical protein
LNRLSKSDTATYKKICDLSLKIKKQSEKLRTDYRLLQKTSHPLHWLLAGTIALIASFPLFVWGYIFSMIFIEIPKLPLKNIADRQFHSTIKYGISLVLAFIFLPLYCILAFIFISPWWLALIVFISIPFSGLFAWNYGLLFNRVSGGFRIRKYIIEKQDDYNQLKKNNDELMGLISKL